MSHADFTIFVRQRLPKAFLHPLFRRTQPFEVLAGAQYTAKEAEVNGFDTNHDGVDYRVNRGTLVLAPFSGWLTATFEEVPLSREFSYDWAVQTYPHETNLRVAGSTAQAQQQWGGGGLMLQLVDPATKTYMQFGHLDELLLHDTPFECEVTEQEGIAASPQFRRLPGEFTARNALWVEAGTVIAKSGISGCGWDRSSYSYATISANKPPRFTNMWIPHWSDPHLHVLMGVRHPVTRRMAIVDPHGNYSTREHYSADDMSRPGLVHHSLWLPG